MPNFNGIFCFITEFSKTILNAIVMNVRISTNFPHLSPYADPGVLQKLKTFFSSPTSEAIILSKISILEIKKHQK